MKRWKTILYLTLVALGVRIVLFVLLSDWIVVGSDAAEYIWLGRKFAAGNYYGVLDTYWPPLYPLLIGIVTTMFDSLTLPAVIVSIVAGSLVVPLTYWLAEESYGKATAMVASIIAIFFPHLLNSVFSLGSENPYVVLTTGCLLTGWVGLTKDSVVSWLVTGMLLALAYLTRPEAFGYLIFFAFLIMVGKPFQREFVLKRRLIQMSVLTLGFAILATPYLVYLHGQTGTWTISAKVQTNIAGGAFSDNALERSLKAMEVDPDADERSLKALFFNTLLNLREAHVVFSSLIPPFLAILVGLGLFCTRWDRERTVREGYLIAFCLVTVAGYVMSFVIERYFLVLLPVFFVWIARGILFLRDWYEESSLEWNLGAGRKILRSSQIPSLLLVLMILYLSPTLFFIRSKESAWQSRAFSERDAGVWLRENGQVKSKVFAFSSVPIFYSDYEGFWTDAKDPDEILRQILSNNVGYVLDSERSYTKRPHLADLTERLKVDPRFERIYERNEFPGNRVAIYRVKRLDG